MLAVACLFGFALWDTVYALSSEFQYQNYIQSVAEHIAEPPAETLPDSPLLYEDEAGRE